MGPSGWHQSKGQGRVLQQAWATTGAPGLGSQALA